MSEQEFLNQLAACNCCPTHQINKPIKLAPWVEMPFPGPRSIEEKREGCKCDCRHLARFVCRDACGPCTEILDTSYSFIIDSEYNQKEPESPC